jgi:acyl-CoA synthetase (AMP-forming)/AMP-acid ligase II
MRVSVAAARTFTREIEQLFVSETIGAFVARRARELGNLPALDVFERGEKASYAELDAWSDRVGHALAALGVRKGDRVAAMAPNRIEYPVLWLALAKLGAIHVPINVRYTPREIAYVLADSQARIAVVDPDYAESMSQAVQALAVPPRILPIDGAGTTLRTLADAADGGPCLDPSVEPSDTMNIQYTSGTTGFPKGCVLSHEYWMILAFAAEHWDERRPARLLTAQPFFYMDPQWHLLKAMRLGATLFVAPGLSSTRFIRWIKTHRVEWCQFPILMTRQPEAPDDWATALKQVATFGWDAETCRAFKRRFAVCAREAFGMTEIGLGTWMRPECEDMYDSASVGIDAPFRETTIRDEAGLPVPEGGRGELWVRGRGIFGGYWNNPEANADAMREGGWFRTGDLFEADGDGCLWLVGRLKDMIRRSSENIAAREVEAIVRELPGVEDCAAISEPDPTRGEEIKIVVQRKAGYAAGNLPPEAILAHCRGRLAPFKVPRYYVFVDDFPRTVSNKIEKRKLAAALAEAKSEAWDAEGKSGPSASKAPVTQSSATINFAGG